MSSVSTRSPCTTQLHNIDHSSLDWDTVTPAEETFFSNQPRQVATWDSEPKGSNIKSASPSFVYRVNTGPCNSQVGQSRPICETAEEDTTGVVSTQSSVINKKYLIVDEHLSLLGRSFQFLIEKDNGWDVRISDNGDTMTCTFRPGAGIDEIYESAAGAHDTRRLRQLILERSGLPGYLGRSSPREPPNAEMIDGEQHITLYYNWEPVPSMSTAKRGAFDNDRFFVKPSITN
ncbi:hypothetical protein I203_100666 [Kwoniella mangroviensis CBS 8507]|uniref:uncharacterized protein n=1 Tax=Kwoniella mangroviensis CBS 8507 TaxID=1296122 RepID=UPI00080D02F2|nr:uncharacterized protein I203_06799 [Kwoniella mangroviensis CBS 8507]OCF64215.1 hypothetical protein I203_06799 [Kwoniella mangroviensis CBS 8507]